MEPSFTPENERKFEEIVSRYPRRDAAIIPVLWLAQEQFRLLSPGVRRYVAAKLGVSLARVESVVSFYTMFRTRKAGKHHIQVCRNISCDLAGTQALMDWVEKVLEIKPGDTSADGLFSYSTVECLAACAGAPALQVDGDYHEKMTVESLAELVRRLKGET